MAWYLLRVKQNRWLGKDYSWILANDFPAPPLQDFTINESGQQSVWHIEGDESNLTEVITALAATRAKFDHFDFILFPQTAVAEAGLATLETEGTTPHVNANPWHRDIIELSARRLVELAHLVFQQGRRDRRQARVIEAYLRGALNNGQLIRDQVNENLKSKLK